MQLLDHPKTTDRALCRRAPCLLALIGTLMVSPVAGQDGAIGGSDVAVRGVVIPTGFQNRQYSAMVQVAVDGSPLPDAKWDLDATFVPDGGTPEKFSGRVTAGEPGTPVVLEFQVEFAPGPYALTLEARETTAGQSGTVELEGGWPNPIRDPATVSPVVLLQPVQGAFLRGENARAQGALALAENDVVRPDLPTAVVSVACRKVTSGVLVRVERRLQGASTVEFETIKLGPGREPCAQLRDLIPPGAMGAGHFRYEVRLSTESGVIATSVREFTTVGTPGSGRGS